MKQLIRSGIIDDEPHGIKTLKHYLEKSGLAHVVFAADSGENGLKLLKEEKIDILFLDIEMPGLNGFELLQQLPGIGFKVVFVTAYNQYAIRAIKMNALDYLLKPLDKKELDETLQKYLEQSAPTTREQLAQLHVYTENKVQDTLALSTLEGLHFIKIQDIVFLEADDCYTYVNLTGNRKFVISKTLAHFEELLEGQVNFFRVHKSYLINLQFIQKYIRGDGGEIIMTDGKHIALSRNRKNDFLKLFKKL
jgi:two-component system, LytTR family, response regulator